MKNTSVNLVTILRSLLSQAYLNTSGSFKRIMNLCWCHFSPAWCKIPTSDRLA